MVLAILYKKDKVEIYDNINTLRIEKGKLFFTSGQLYEYSFTKPLDEVAKVSVNSIVYYDNGEGMI